jgi:glucokinase
VKPLAAGVDLGGTNIATAIVDASGRVRSRDRRPTLAGRGPNAVLARMADSVRSAARVAGLGLRDLAAVGVGSPGPLDPKRGVVLYSENLRWRNVPVAAVLRRALGRRVFLENDANVAALGEAWAGAGRGEPVVLCVTLGTGVGGGLILDGRIYRGAWDVGCEIGHIVVEPGGPPTRYGNRGVLEQYVSATGIVRMAREAGLKPRGGEAVLTARDMMARARSGDPRARRVYREAGRMLGVGLTTAIHLLNPSMVVFAGGVSAAGPLLYGPMRREIARRCFRASLRGLKFRRAALGGDMGAVGAARLAFLGLEGAV